MLLIKQTIWFITVKFSKAYLAWHSNNTTYLLCPGVAKYQCLNFGEEWRYLGPKFWNPVQKRREALKNHNFLKEFCLETTINPGGPFSNFATVPHERLIHSARFLRQKIPEIYDFFITYVRQILQFFNAID